MAYMRNYDKKIFIYIFVAEVDQKRRQLSKSIYHKLSSI